MRKTTRRIIEDLAEEYLNSKDYHRGFINSEWIMKITDELNLANLSDYELSNMWDMVHLTLANLFNHYYVNEEHRTAMKYLDVQSAFTEVVNREARRRRGE